MTFMWLNQWHKHNFLLSPLGAGELRGHHNTKGQHDPFLSSWERGRAETSSGSGLGLNGSTLANMHEALGGGGISDVSLSYLVTSDGKSKN